MKVKIWGCRGSLPAPLLPLQVEDKIIQAIRRMPDLDTKDESAVSAYVHGLHPLSRGTAGGNTTCVEVQTGGAAIVIDAGTGIRDLGLEMLRGSFGRGQGEMHLLFSHPHWDHIQGFPFFMPAFIPGNRITIYSVHDLEKALVDQQASLTFPVPMSIMDADIKFVRLEPGRPFTIGKIKLNTIRNAHPGDSYAYRIEDEHSTFVFASDAEFKELDDTGMQPHIAFFQDADALIFDAQYTLGEGWVKEDWGHSSAMIGVEMALAAGVKRLILFHHDPTNDDVVLQQILADAQAYRNELGGEDVLEVEVAYEGLVLDLTPAGAVGESYDNWQGAPILVPTRVFDEQSVQQMADKLVVLDEPATGAGRIIDLSQVETLTTASLKQLVQLQQDQGRAPLVLAAPSPSAMRVIELGGLTEFFAIYPTVEAAQTAVAARETAQLPGHMLGNRYLIQRALAKGAMGTLLLATDKLTDETVTIRIIDPAYSEDTRRRLFQQRAALMTADHPNLLPLFDLGTEDELTYLVEAYAVGQTLDKLVNSYPQGLPAAKAMEIALAIVDGIQYAHSQGIVHGNLKADKIYVDDERVRIGAMALGRLDEGLDLREVPIIRQESAYLAPEQIMGRPIDARTDLYALGVVLYQLFTGRLPFEGSEYDVLQAHLNETPLSPDQLNSQLSPFLVHLILKLLAKSPAHRYGSTAQVRRILQALDIQPGSYQADAAHLFEDRALFVGREHELPLLSDMWEKAASGAGQLLFISGEQGIGKTRLTEEFARQAQAPVVLIGRSLERRGSRAFAPFGEALLAYLNTVPPELLNQVALKHVSEFAAVIPDVHKLIPDLSIPPPLEPEQEQLRRMNGITRFIAQATRDRPWILILDDLQWADDGTLALLRYLSFELPDMPLLLIAAYRQSSLPETHPLQEVISSLSDHKSVSQINLERFDKYDLVELVIDKWDAHIPKSLLETIFEHTGGNPLFIREVMESLVAENLVRFEHGSWIYPKPEAVQLPRSLQEVVRRRVNALNPGAQTLLQQAAVLGQEFQIDVLQQMSELSEWSLLETLDIALQHSFVRESRSDGFLRFQHHDMQLALYNSIPAVRRRLWHKTAAEILERGAQPEADAIAEILAIHFAEAEMAEKAIHYSFLAAEHARVAYNNDAAVEWYGQVVSWIEKLAADEQESWFATHAAALLQLGTVLELVGEWDEARRQYTDVMELAQTAEDRTFFARSQIALGELCRKQGGFEEALEWYEKAAVQLRQGGDQEGLAQVLHYKGNVAAQQADLDTAHRYYTESLTLRRELGNQEGIAHMLNNLAVVAEFRGHYDESLALHEQALELRREIGDRRMVALSLNNLGDLLLIEGAYADARRNLEEAIMLYREIGDRWLLAQSLGNLGSVARETGEIGEARTYYQESLGIFLDLHDPWAKAHQLDDVARLFFALGDARTALRLTQAALALRGNIAAPLPPTEQASLDEFVAQLHAALGDTASEIADDPVLSADEAIDLALRLLSESA